MFERRELVHSYRVPVIWGTVIAIAVAGLACGWLVGRDAVPPPWAEGLDGVLTMDPVALALAGEDSVAEMIAAAEGDPAELIHIAMWLHHEGDAAQRREGLAAWPTTGEGAIPLVGPALIPLRDAQAPAVLLGAADADAPLRWANHVLGALFELHQRLPEAVDRFAREGVAFAEARESRELAVELAIELELHAQLAVWSDQAAWHDVFDAHTRFRLAIAREDWSDILQWLLPSQYVGIDAAFLAIAALAALVYLFFLWHCSYRQPRRIELGWLCLAGFGLGIVSTWLTILVILAQEQLGWKEGSSSFDQAVYAIFGIGLREELLKLLCFLPLAPSLVRRHGPLAWLLVASCVGVGFAAEENLNYYQGSSGSAVGGRFLTANFLHLALTGLAGHALCQALRWPRAMAGHALGVFAMVVIAHGLYDAFLMVDALQLWGLSWGYLVVFVLTGNAYFAILAQEREGPRPDLSLTMVFCAGLTLVLAVALVLLSASFGFAAAALLLLPGSLASAIVVVMFVRGIGDRLSA